MAIATVASPALTIQSGTTSSNALVNLDDAIALAIFASTALTGTVTVQVEPTSTGSAWSNLQSGGVDVTIAATKAIVLNPMPFKQLRLLSNASEGATRTFSVLRSMPV